MFFSLAIFLFIAGSVILMFKGWHPRWWEKRWLRRAVKVVVALGVVGIGLRVLGMSQSSGAGRAPTMTIIGAALLGPASVLALMLFVSLPFAALLRAVGNLAARLAPKSTVASPSSVEASTPLASVDPPAKREPAETEADAKPHGTALPTVGRRAVLEGVVAAVPIATLGAGLFGVGGAYARTRVEPLPMRFSELPQDLRGLKILQLTDLHLGAFLDLGSLENILEDAHAASPDLVLITGDFSDHLPWLASALSKVASLKPRLGSFAVFGNHEHYRGAPAARRIYDASNVELLVDKHRVIRVGNTDVALIGVDDPAGGTSDDFYERASDLALDGSPTEAWKLGLCHRPSGFQTLAARGVDLTLSGHTHGAQVGLHGRSILEGVAPDAMLWGRYAIGKQQLYTSSGGGHWFAFRLNCPSEAPIITLELA